MKTSESAESLTQLGKSRVEVDNDSRTGRDGRCKLDKREIGDNKVDDEVDDEFYNKIEKKGQKTSKFKNLFKKLSKFKKTVRLDFFIFKTRLAFTKLRQAFFKAPILHHFDSKRHIQIKTDALGYIINNVFNQLISDNLV